MTALTSVDDPRGLEGETESGQLPPRNACPLADIKFVRGYVRLFALICMTIYGWLFMWHAKLRYSFQPLTNRVDPFVKVTATPSPTIWWISMPNANLSTSSFYKNCSIEIIYSLSFLSQFSLLFVCVLEQKKFGHQCKRLIIKHKINI